MGALESGWSGPPYDPFQLAELIGIDLVARQDLDDARLVAMDTGPRIEFNPVRSPARVRFSVAHEIGHWLFPDFAERVRYRDRTHRRGDDWQLEVLCNIAAAEFLMPVGAFPITHADELSLSHLLDLRAEFGVSTEAILRRAVKLTGRPYGVFAAARLDDDRGFRIDYVLPSRAWHPPVSSGALIPPTSVLRRCTAVGFADDAAERWADIDTRIQAVGVPPYPGERFPRLVGLLEPVEDVEMRNPGLRYVRGDASAPRTDAPAIIAHVVNDRARSWGGRGFALTLMKRFSKARDQYRQWAEKGNATLGRVHVADAADRLWIASLVAQAGYGDTASPGRLRVGALRQALAELAIEAAHLDAEVHMPLIGTGQAGAKWPTIRDLILEELADRQIAVTVYVLPDAVMPEEVLPDEQLSLPLAHR
jgi:O-acetyl-ADP-ribose deacetylase (regulator of RNase III)